MEGEYAMTNENQQGTKTTRRNFLKGAGLALAGATAFGLAGCASGEADSASSNEKWDGEYDVIVAGAGIAGLSAAITVADEGDGASCLVGEKDSLPNPTHRGRRRTNTPSTPTTTRWASFSSKRRAISPIISMSSCFPK